MTEMKPWITLFFVVIITFLQHSGVSAYSKFGKACVLAHNKLRKLHGSKPLVWSEDLRDEAQKWCEALAINDKLEHDNEAMDKKNQGENIAAVTVNDQSGGGNIHDLCKKIVKQWYSEEQNYNYQTGMPKAPGLPVKHFAQVVWNSSFEIGVGFARSTDHGDIICARYSPRGAGGSPAKFKENVSLIKTVGQEGEGDESDDKKEEKEDGEDEEWSWGGGVTHGENGNNGGSISCGVGKSSRIVGGTQAKPEEFPWQVGLVWNNGSEYTGIFCGGSLINKQWVVTAAHCFMKTPPPPVKLKVVLGEFDVRNLEGNEVLITAKNVIPHPIFVPNAKMNDIALVQLEREVSFNDYMKPVCLPKGDTNFAPGKVCTVTGFGAVSFGGNSSTTLKKTDLSIVEHKTCSKIYGPQVLDQSFCAGGNKTDTCQGDSGGPLVCQKDGKFYLMGVVSFGIGCATPGFPGLYANVTSFMEWIERVQKLNE